MKLQAFVHRRKPRIEMIPLIDIVFLLLVFFIYAMISMTVHRGVKVVLPKTVTGAVERRMPINVTLKADGTVQVEAREVALQELPRVVAALRQERPEAPVLIAGDKAAPLGLGLEVLDRLRTAGVERVTFLTEQKKGAQ